MSSASERRMSFCTTREAAEKLGVSLRTVQLWVENGTLEAWKTDGGHRRVSLASVERLLTGEAPGQHAGMATDRLKVLVAEDDNILLKLYKVRLGSCGLPLDVVTAPNGYEALILVGRESPDLLITDLDMPGMDGYSMLRTLSTSPFREGMEMVVVTGMTPESIAEHGGLPDGVKLFHKPVPFNELRGLCEELLQRRREF